jgi:undecaprenyl diphosphate synthase
VRPRPAVGLTIAVQRSGRAPVDGTPDGSERVSASRAVACAAVSHGIDLSRVPAHVAIVMDGNGRWAQRRGLKRTEGHAAGEEALFDAVEGALEIGLRWMTVYAFSTENWRRPLDEVRFLMRFNESLLLRRRDDLHQRGVRVRFIGRRGGRVPRRVLRHIEDTEALTRRNRRMTLTFAFNYGGRAELVDAVRSIASEVSARRLKADTIDDRTIKRHLYAPDMPDPDVLVRTSGEYRTSNFLLWEAAYSELVFTDVLWPDFRRGDLFAAVREYQQRERRFGAIEGPSAAT